MSKDRSHLVTGKVYKIVGEDCCVNFVVERAKFVRFGDPDGPSEEEFVFDCITIGPDWGNWTTEEVDDDKRSRIAKHQGRLPGEPE